MTNSIYDLLKQYKGDGPYLYIKDQKKIDAASGTFNLPVGYTNERIATKLKEQIDRCCHLSSNYTREISECILKKLIKYTPKDINRIWLRDVSGSGAVECAIRMSQKATGKSGVISLYLAHHGQSLATAQISGNAFRIKDFRINIEGSLKIPVPPSVMADSSDIKQTYNFADLEQMIEYGSNNNIACLILEPIMGNGGNIVIPTEYYTHIRNICKKYGIKIIADEVQTGFGRTGTFFASKGYADALDPDIIVFAKGAGGIGIPTGGVLMKKELDVLESFEHSSTSGANPLSLVALNEIIDIIEDDKLLDNVKNNESYLLDGLIELQNKYSNITCVRGIGYMFGFDTPSPEFAAQAIEVASNNNLIIRGSRYGKSGTLKVRPPISCNREHLSEILDKLDATFSEMAKSSLAVKEVA